MTQRVPYGAWPSPLSADLAAAGSSVLSAPDLVEGEVWWCESRVDEGGRVALVRERADGTVEDVLGAPWSVKTRVHEYGGPGWTWFGTPDGPVVVFAHGPDQRLHRLDPGSTEPRPLTDEPDEPGGDRYADLTIGLDPPHVVCVRERHSAGTVSRAVVAIPLDGGPARVLVADGHFLAAARVSPDGRHLAWIRWDHPAMPWDGTELRIAALADDGPVDEPATLLGGPDESVLQPEWVGADELVVLSDRSGFWNLHAVGIDGDVRDLCPRTEEFASPMWEIGSRWYAVCADGRIACRHGLGEARVGLLDPATGVLTDPPLPYRSFGGGLAGQQGDLHADERTLVFVGGHPAAPSAVVAVDLASGHDRTVRSSATTPDPSVLAPARAVSLDSPAGRIHAIVYPPHNGDLAGLDGERPPYVIRIHGGPTAHEMPRYDPAVAFHTSRGIGFVDLNHRGSTGYGRQYRNLLRGGWAAIDVEDAVAAAALLAEEWGADPDRIAITGQSAGGGTVLAALAGTRAFACGMSWFGVGDLLALAGDTHDFESRYLDSLIAPLPEGESLYRERSAINRADEITSPVLLLQGEDDPVVPPSQARSFAARLHDNGVPHVVRFFAGEGHGFRRRDSIVAALETQLAFLGAVMGFEPPGVPPLDLGT